MGKIKIKKDIYSAGFSGSLIQQNHGEKIQKHGFLLWNITDKDNFTVEEYDIPNEHNYITFIANHETDYDNIDFKSKYLNPNSNVRIKWQDISANINFENEVKLRNYFKDKFNIPKIKIKKESIYTDVSDVEMINESIDLSNVEVQKQIFQEYLKMNGYDDNFIEDVLNIDFIINGRMDSEKVSMGITWSINKLWFENFKSYGDLTKIDWENKNGLYQIHGINQQGKSTILDAICYILYGKTISTVKRERNGDNRYINNKRNLDYCEGGCVINVNGEQYTILRRTERKWNRQKTDITSCSTNVSYYKGTEISDENNQTEEQKKDTQKFIESAIGDFNDFIRLVLTTADNLNDLISMDRSVFIDSVIRDAGYDMFENKLDEFKKYKKDISSSRINFDMDKYENDKKTLNENKLLKKDQLDIIESNIKKLEDKKKPLVSEKDEYLSQLEKIDESLKDFSIDDTNKLIINEKDTIEKREEQLAKIEQLKDEVKDYSDKELKDKKTELSNIKEEINVENLKSKDLDIEISKLESSIKTINMDIKNIINDYIRTLEKKINENEDKVSKLKTDFNNKIIEYKSDIKDDINKMSFQQNSVQTNINNLMNEGKLLKTENDNLEHSKVCVTCHRPLEEKDLIVIGKTIEENKSKMVDIMEKVKLLKGQLNEWDKLISDKNDILTRISEKDYSFDNEIQENYKNVLDTITNYKNDNEDIEKDITLIKDDNLSQDLKNKLKPSYNQKEFIIGSIDVKEDEKKKIENVISTKNGKLDTIKSEIEVLEDADNKYKKKMEAISLEDKINLDIAKCNIEISNYEKQIEKYNNQLSKIENNKKLQSSIDHLNIEIDIVDSDIKLSMNNKSSVDADIIVIDNELELLELNLAKFKKQQRQDEIMNVYLKCVHRDGIPTYLLKKSIGIINQELNNLLSDVDYTIYFDDNLDLKLSNDTRLDVSQNAIESSGMERTFSAVALKLALRFVNNKSKPSLLLLDEVMAKLVDESVDKFIQLLDSVKNQVDKLIIIEHDKTINYDHLITVIKNEDGISSLVMD